MYAVDVQDFLISQLSDQGLKPRAESNFIIRCDSPTTGVHKRQPLQVDLEKQVWIRAAPEIRASSSCARR